MFTGFFIAGDGAQWHIDIDIFSGATGTIVTAAAFTIFCQHVFVIAQVEEGPEVFIAAQDDMGTATAVAAIGAGFRVEFGAHEMLAAGAAVAAAAEDADLIDEVAFFAQSIRLEEQR